MGHVKLVESKKVVELGLQANFSVEDVLGIVAEELHQPLQAPERSCANRCTDCFRQRARRRSRGGSNTLDDSEESSLRQESAHVPSRHGS